VANPPEVVLTLDEVRAMGLFLRKEWLVFSHRGPLFVFGIYILASLQVFRVEEAFFLTSVVLAGTLALWVPFVEWFQEADPMLHSLPVSRTVIVIGRYLTAILACGVAGLAWSATGRLLLPLLDPGRAGPPLWTTLGGILTYFLSAGLLFALFFPLYFRFGLGKGAVAFLAVSLTLLGMGYGTAGLAGGGAPSRTLGIGGPSTLIRLQVTALLENMGVAGALTLILLGSGGVLAISLFLSRFWYARREF